jgi:hypothetical protein
VVKPTRTGLFRLPGGANLLVLAGTRMVRSRSFLDG